MLDDFPDLDDDAQKKLKMVLGIGVMLLVVIIAMYFISDMISSRWRQEHRREPERKRRSNPDPDL